MTSTPRCLARGASVGSPRMEEEEKGSARRRGINDKKGEIEDDKGEIEDDKGERGRNGK